MSCEGVKDFVAKLEEENTIVCRVWDLSTADGLGEASYYMVNKTPSVIVCKDDEVVKKFIGELPEIDEIKRLV